MHSWHLAARPDRCERANARPDRGAKYVFHGAYFDIELQFTQPMNFPGRSLWMTAALSQ